MLPILVVAFVAFGGASFAVQRTSRRAEKPGRWSRNGLLGIGTISMVVMAGLIAIGQGTAAFLLLGVWFPGIVAGILIERVTYRPASSSQG